MTSQTATASETITVLLDPEEQARFRIRLLSMDDFITPGLSDYRHRKSRGEELILVSKEDGVIAGWLVFEEQQEERAEIVWIFVEEEYRRKGHGTNLISALKEVARDQALLCVFIIFEDPFLLDNEGKENDRAKQVASFLSSAGVYVLDIPFNRPPLSEGGEWCDDMMIGILPVYKEPIDDLLPAAPVIRFLSCWKPRYDRDCPRMQWTWDSLSRETVAVYRFE